MAIDPKHLPEDAKILQQMVLDLMAQLDREFIERSKIEALLRELLDAKRDRKSEQLSADQLAPSPRPGRRGRWQQKHRSQVPVPMTRMMMAGRVVQANQVPTKRAAAASRCHVN